MKQMTDILLAVILIVLLLDYLNWTPGAIRDYLGWRKKQAKRGLNNWKARRRAKRAR
jgi:hypothetical protein